MEVKKDGFWEQEIIFQWEIPKDTTHIEPEILQSEIIYKKILPEDFPYYQASFHQISPNEQGHISKQIDDYLKYEDRNTVVINAGVGQGKTHSILRIAKKYFDNGFIVVFAVPYKSLVSEYKADLINLDIKESEILDYQTVANNYELQDKSNEKIENPILPLDASLRNIHLMTVNALLGNSGEDYVKQSQKKIDYINFLIDRCKKDNKKVVWIFDEIHDSIHNFQQKLIFNLWKWKGILAKTFCISATYNEASKVVIKYLSELIEGEKIQIIESQRTRIDAKRSDLFLMLFNKPIYSSYDNELIEVFKYLISRKKKINILSFSSNLANQLVDSKTPMGALLKNEFGEVNLCTGDSKGKFNNDQCNVGTTFSTGINIIGEDKVLVIFLPTSYSNNDNKNLGIFTRGINTLIQALARVRSKSEIYIIMPKPTILIRDKQNTKYIDNVIKNESLNELDAQDVYEDINNQRHYIESVYNSIRNNVENEIKAVKEKKEERELKKKPSLNFPELDDFILADGEKLLVQGFDIFGRNLSNYITWAAFNDQFLNCKLKDILKLNELILEEGKVLESLYKYMVTSPDFIIKNSNGKDDLLLNYISEKELLPLLRDSIFSNNVYLLKKDGKKYLLRKNNRVFESQILAALNIHYCITSNAYYEKHFLSKGKKFIDFKYTVTDYLISCLVSSEYYQYIAEKRSKKIPIKSDLKMLESYHHLYSFFKKYPSLYFSNFKGKTIVESGLDKNPYSKEELNNYKEAILYIKENDYYIKSKIFGLFQDINSDSSDKDIVNCLKFIVNKYLIDTELYKPAKYKEEIRPNLKQFKRNKPQFKGRVLNLLANSEDITRDDINSIEWESVSFEEL